MKDEHLEAKDLMIGDWVSYSVYINGKENKPYEKKIQISNIYGNAVNCETEDYSIVSGTSLIECYPIPLTPKILEKNGFKKEKYNMYTAYYFPNNDDLQNRGFALEECNNIYKITDHQLMPIRYVHELQHALRLCGLTELAENFKV